ncbi:fumarylacetoacetate hydrolase family protein [Nitriliruptor alkaliphilus]|uniref:fumarylacetoacetate hydrolase family protein n=1 Tax=Nitriliruptor alkaliphilus TaxID=427918 RepID=UPI000698CC5E|nr:fumarylacetoacetate hydrolase family protein [Nitriliruptor alkaliphilus]
MKLLRVGPRENERPAVLAPDGRAYDASTIAPDDYGPAFFATGGPGRLQDALDAGELPELDLAGRRLGAPIPRPGKIVCIGLNFADHAAEAGAATPDEPVVFFKAPNTVVGPNDEVLLPIGGEKADWEIELGVIIGATARYLPDDEAAAAAIAGYCTSNDLSERSFQLERGGQWVKGKSCETFNPLGPWLVTPDEVDDPGKLDMWLDVNGHRKQDSNTAHMVFSVPYLIRYLSQFMVLEPGDLINTGTPAGVGLASDPPEYLTEGDVMELGIAGLGTQRQICGRAAP